MPKFGEFNSAQLKPTWESKTGPGNDEKGYKRGFRGFAGKDDGEWMKSFDPTADRKAYGTKPDGGLRTSSNSRDPGTITNDGDKGYRGIDE